MPRSAAFCSTETLAELLGIWPTSSPLDLALKLAAFRYILILDHGASTACAYFYRMRGNFALLQLFLDDFLLPPNESASIVRDNDIIE